MHIPLAQYLQTLDFKKCFSVSSLFLHVSIFCICVCHFSHSISFHICGDFLIYTDGLCLPLHLACWLLHSLYHCPQHSHSLLICPYVPSTPFISTCSILSLSLICACSLLYPCHTKCDEGLVVSDIDFLFPSFI